MVKSVTLPNQVTLEYVEQGDLSGIPLVFLHGATDSWKSFAGVLPHMPASIHAIAVSQRGHGDSSRPENGYQFADFSTDLELFLNALDIRAAFIVGHSMGSYVAQWFAIDHPGRTLGLVLMGSFPTMRSNVVVRELWDSAVATLSDPVDTAFITEFQESTLARPVPSTLLDTAVRESQKVPAPVWRATFREFLEADLSHGLPGMTAPTLIMWGDRDAICTRADQDILLGAIPGSRLIVYQGAGHAIHWEDPDRVSRDLLDFVEHARHGRREAIASEAS